MKSPRSSLNIETPTKHVGPDRPRRNLPSGFVVDDSAEDMLAAVNRSAHLLQARLWATHKQFRKAMRHPKGSNGRRKKLAPVLAELEAVDEEARRLHIHEQVMQPIFIELMDALRNNQL